MAVRSPGDVRDLHATLSAVPALLAQRRAVYSAAIELSGGGASQVPDAVLDNPAVRAHLGAVLGGTAALDPAQLVPVDDLVEPGSTFPVSGGRVRVASSPAAPAALGPAVDRITGQLQRHGDRSGPRLLVGADPAFAPALEVLREGVELAVRLAPELVADLLPHVAVIAVLAQDDAGRLGSASSREHPGLIMVPEPRSALEMAEALVHEGAHQKFFDLAITRSLFGPDHGQAPAFSPPWAPPGAPPWLLEQCFAAFHAYVLLSVLHRAVGDGQEPPAGSLLPVAAERATVLGDWLVGRGAFLGADGRTLVELLHGTRPVSGDRSDDALPPADLLDRAEVVRHCDGRTLVVRSGSPVELFWVAGAEGTPELRRAVGTQD